MKEQEKAWNKLYEQGLIWKKTSKGLFSLNGKSVLELGVGNGKTLKAIIEKNPKKVVAIDISEEGVSKAKESIKSDKISYVTQDFLKYKTKEKFDAIFCYYFLNNFNEKNRRKVTEKMRSLLSKNGIILFEDFGNYDFRKQKGKEIEPNTIQKSNEIICHFFDKKELKELFKDFDIEIQEKTFNPIRKNKSIKRKIIKAKIYGLGRI